MNSLGTVTRSTGAAPVGTAAVRARPAGRLRSLRGGAGRAPAVSPVRGARPDDDRFAPAALAAGASFPGWALRAVED
ncbi:MAG: hypothetical protein KJ792_05770 [Actinobacteria bacterium]|nr:hypothetical protein [Actinomycetota bacterium]